MKLANLKLILFCHCRQASFLASEALDRELTLSERWALRIHTFLCKSCRRIARQLREIHQLAAKLPDGAQHAADCLCDERKRQIAAAMRETD